MDNNKIMLGIRNAIAKNPFDLSAYNDFFQMNRLIAEEEHNGNVKPTFDNIRWLRSELNKQIRSGGIGADLIIEMTELLKKTYLYMARADFDSYMIYLEWDRKPAEKFYQPRRKIMYQLTVAIQKLLDNELDELFLSMPPRVGKALANDTLILTPDGWKKHGDLKVGDRVFRPNGEIANIINVNPKCQMTHRVTMTDGSTFDCHENHEWRVWDRRFNAERVLETHELIGHLESGGHERKRGHRYNFQLLINDPIKGIEKELPVKPYSFGAWLGDGSNSNPRISGDKRDKAIIDAMIEEGYVVKNVYTHATTGVLCHDFGMSLRADLRKIGLCVSHKRNDKYIPDCYLTASIQQRLELLAGLIDTDGCLRRKEHRYDFVTSDEKLKDGIITLISTFGWRCGVVEAEPKVSTSGICGKHKYWKVSFNPTMEIPCRLERKQLKEFSKQRRIAIKSIEPLTEYIEGNCISLDVLDGMYLAGRTLTPTHNTTFLMFLMTMIIGMDSERSNLYSAFSDTITKAFYQGVLEIINDSATYLWHDIFPDAKIVGTNSQEETINIDRRKRYPSLTARSLYGTLNGACDCNGFLISDDLIGGIEEALNKDRLYSAWSKVDNNLIPRAKETARLLWCGTRWSQVDPAGLRMAALQGDKRFEGRRYEIINLPALNEAGESNFDYPYNVGFSTKYYLQRKASFEKNGDLPSWNAQYMGQPVERSGVLFEMSDFTYFNGELPDEKDIIRKFMVVDPAYGGGDYTAAPVCYQSADGLVYVVDVIYSNGDKKVTQPMIVNKIKKWGIKACQFECTRATAAYQEKVDEMLKAEGIKCNLSYRPAPTVGAKAAKQYRVFDCAPEIKDTFRFLEGKYRDKYYEQFMTNVFSFSLTGDNKHHDDAPDSLAQACKFIEIGGTNIKILKRVF